MGNPKGADMKPPKGLVSPLVAVLSYRRLSKSWVETSRVFE